MSTTHFVYVLVGISAEEYMAWYQTMFPGSKSVIEIDQHNNLFDVEDYLKEDLEYVEGYVGLIVDGFHDVFELDKNEMRTIEDYRSDFAKICKNLPIEPQVFFIKSSY